MNNNKQRRLKRKIKEGNKEALELDITSLLDILVILLVFLLKSYNASDLKIDLAEQVVLPNSRSSILGNQSIIVQINKQKKIFIDNKLIGELRTTNNKIPSLFTELTARKKILQTEFENIRIPASVTEKDMLNRKKDKMKKINIVLDKSLPYSVLSQVMHTSALAGFPEFKFIVQGKYE
jgi:biopolymer transport protein ExbD